MFLNLCIIKGTTLKTQRICLKHLVATTRIFILAFRVYATKLLKNYKCNYLFKSCENIVQDKYLVFPKTNKHAVYNKQTLCSIYVDIVDYSLPRMLWESHTK